MNAKGHRVVPDTWGAVTLPHCRARVSDVMPAGSKQTIMLGALGVIIVYLSTRPNCLEERGKLSAELPVHCLIQENAILTTGQSPIENVFYKICT